MKCLSRFSRSRFFIRNGFDDFASLKAGSTDIHAADRTVLKTDFHALNIREETAAGDAGNLFTDTAGFLGKTSPGNGASYDRFFVADGTMLHKADIIAAR
jgi:hypothetical protein